MKKNLFKLKINLIYFLLKFKKNFKPYFRGLYIEFKNLPFIVLIIIGIIFKLLFSSLFQYYLFFILIFKLLPLFFYKFMMRPGNTFKMFFGLPGSGKTTLAAYLSTQYKNVWSNVPISGCFEIDIENDLGVYMIQNGLLIIDEAGIEHNNRDFKTFQKRMLRWYKKHRHYNVDVVYFSQGFDDVDKKLRDLTTELHITSNFTRFFIMTKPIIKYVGVDPLSNQIVFLYKLAPFWRFRIYRPSKYWKLFKSRQMDDLAVKEWQKYV